MKHTLILVAMLTTCFPGAFAQQPDGSDINKAIPIYFGQVATGIGDPAAKPAFIVYSVAIAKGQQVTFAANTTSGSGQFELEVYRSSALTVGSAQSSDIAVSCNCSNRSSSSLSYLASASGTYYIVVYFKGSSFGYQLSVQATGTPIAIPNPQTAGCLIGTVNYITYSLQLIAAGLPDEVSIGGNRACATCTVKPPLYPEISSRLESALKSKVNVEACYDSGGNMFQIKLVSP
jgi:hypothetical protein